MSLRAIRKPRPGNQPKNPIGRPVPEERLSQSARAIEEKFKLKYTLCSFQVDAIKAQLRRTDVLVHAGLGFGKTVIAAGPHAFEEVKGKVTFFVSPLIALQEEQVATFKKEFGLQAVTINSSHGGLSKERISEIRAGKYQIVIVSPEAMLSKVFITQLIRHKDMAKRVLAVVVDKAHVVSLWGADFRKKYATLGILKALLPRGTPFAAMSATLAPRVQNNVIAKLQLNQGTLST